MNPSVVLVGTECETLLSTGVVRPGLPMWQAGAFAVGCTIPDEFRDVLNNCAAQLNPAWPVDGGHSIEYGSRYESRARFIVNNPVEKRNLRTMGSPVDETEVTGSTALITPLERIAINLLMLRNPTAEFVSVGGTPEEAPEEVRLGVQLPVTWRSQYTT